MLVDGDLHIPRNAMGRIAENDMLLLCNVFAGLPQRFQQLMKQKNMCLSKQTLHQPVDCHVLLISQAAFNALRYVHFFNKAFWLWCRHPTRKGQLKQNDSRLFFCARNQHWCQNLLPCH